MIDALIGGLLAVLQWKAFSFMLIGIGVGFWVGLLPGIGGLTSLALMLPFIYNGVDLNSVERVSFNGQSRELRPEAPYTGIWKPSWGRGVL